MARCVSRLSKIVAIQYTKCSLPQPCSQIYRLVAYRGDPRRRDRPRMYPAQLYFAPYKRAASLCPIRFNVTLPKPTRTKLVLRQGAARAVVAEIKELRKQAMRKRQLAPASSGEKGYPKARPARGVGVVEDKERTPTKDAAAVGVTAGGGGNDASAVEADHPEAWEWYLKAAACG